MTDHTTEIDAICDMCDHPTHDAEDCEGITGYDHLNGDHFCGCQGSFEEQIEHARAQGWEEAHDEFCVVAGQMLCTLHTNPHLTTSPEEGTRD